MQGVTIQKLLSHLSYQTHKQIKYLLRVEIVLSLNIEVGHNVAWTPHMHITFLVCLKVLTYWVSWHNRDDLTHNCKVTARMMLQNAKDLHFPKPNELFFVSTNVWQMQFKYFPLNRTFYGDLPPQISRCRKSVLFTGNINFC